MHLKHISGIYICKRCTGYQPAVEKHNSWCKANYGRWYKLLRKTTTEKVKAKTECWLPWTQV